MAQDLRKVTFSLNYPQGFFPDDEKVQVEAEELTRGRNGLFHGSTEVIENDLKILKFIIEDEETGEVYQIDPLLVKFKTT